MPDTNLVRCPSCGAINRIARHNLDSNVEPVCGRCKAPLPLNTDATTPTGQPAAAAPYDAKPVTVTDATFAAHVERSPIPVLLDLWAPWCAPCRMIAPILDELASDFRGRVRIAKVNIDENPAIASRFNVASIPTLLVLRHGHETDRIVGAHPKAAIVQRLQRLTA